MLNYKICKKIEYQLSKIFLFLFLKTPQKAEWNKRVFRHHQVHVCGGGGQPQFRREFVSSVESEEAFSCITDNAPDG